MRKEFLLLAGLALSTAAFSQQGPAFGIRAGASASGMRGEAVGNLNDLIDYTNGKVTTSDRTGFFAGGFVQLPLGEKISLEPGLYYSQKGYELKGELNVKNMEFIGARANARLNMHYVDLPLLLKADLGGLQLFAGPQLSYLASSDFNMRAGVLGFNLFNRTLDATDQFNRWDAAVTGGVGYQFDNGLQLSAAYDHGLSRVDAGQNLNTYNRSFKLGLGMRF